MSMTALNWARAQKLNPTRAHVLKELANRADDEGRCWPSINRIAEDTFLSRRTVIRCLNDLAGCGLIVKTLSVGHSTLYRLQLAQSTAAAPSAGSTPATDEVPKSVQGSTENGAPPKTVPVTTCHPPGDNVSPPSDNVSPLGVTECHPESKVETKGKTNRTQSVCAHQAAKADRSAKAAIPSEPQQVNVVTFVPAALREPPKPRETYSPAWEPAQIHSINDGSAEAERLRRSREEGIRELERLDAEIQAKRLARLGGMKTASARA